MISRTKLYTLKERLQQRFLSHTAGYEGREKFIYEWKNKPTKKDKLTVGDVDKIMLKLSREKEI